MEIPEGFTSGEQEDQRAQEKEQIREMVGRLLEPKALERLDRVRLVNPKTIESIEMDLFNKAKNGKVRSQISDATLVSMLENVSKKKASSIRFARRKGLGDSDASDDDDDDLA